MKLKKIAIVGPESTGKSTLTASLADYYKTIWVPEYAREYLENLGKPYEEEDLLNIAKGQQTLEDDLSGKANKVLFCDTNHLVIKVWSDHKYGKCNPWILKQLEKSNYDLYLLTYIDIPWEYDPQREHPHLREYFYGVYKKELTEMAVPFVEIKGSYEERMKKAIESVDLIRKQKN